MKPTIVIVDYGMANLRSVQKAFEKVGHSAQISSDPNQIAEADKLVLPGVGAFRDAINRLNASGLTPILRDHLHGNRPFFGICLGLQLLFTESHEEGIHPGLDFFSGSVVPFQPQPGLKIPHMGWNTLNLRLPAPPLRKTQEGEAVYFVHGYYPVPRDPSIIAATADYPEPFTAAVWKDHVFATQFHPEKSQRVGLTMLREFASWS